MTASYTFDVFSSLDGYGSHNGDWGGYWGKEGPELLEHRLQQYGAPQRMVFGPGTFQDFVGYTYDDDTWPSRMRRLPMTVISNTLDEGPFNWPDATVVRGDAAEVVARLKEESEVPMRSHGSLRINRALLAAGLVDRIQLTIFPAITGHTGVGRIFEGVGDFDVELLESRVLDGRTQELIYRPIRHGRT